MRSSIAAFASFVPLVAAIAFALAAPDPTRPVDFPLLDPGYGGRADDPRPWRLVASDAVASEAPLPLGEPERPSGVDLEAHPPVRPRWPPPADATFDDDASDAQRVEPASSSECELRELRGWLRVRCVMLNASLQLLGGSAEGLYLHADGGDFATTVSATMPLLPGDRRVLQLDAVSPEYGGTTPIMATFSECWVGTPGPHLAFSTPEAFF
ncbi:MAG TPA: hypothetical protein VGG39_04215 [Polyangiaceae bacterium]